MQVQQKYWPNNTKEKLRLLTLFFLVFLLYWPFLRDVNLGMGDAHWYHSMMASALDQFKQGIFPIYVTQGFFNYFGNTIVRAPYYLFLGQLLNFITAGYFSSLCIQHFTVFFTASAAAYSMYCILKKIHPGRPTFALFFAFFYISTPAILGVIYAEDMYYSFMTLPFLPILFYGLIRAYDQNDFLSVILVASALSLLWMAHPPIALWATATCALFYCMRFIWLNTGYTHLLMVVGLFIVFSCWQFTAIYGLSLGSEYVGNFSKTYVDMVLSTLNLQMPGVFLPLEIHYTRHKLHFLQLGYTLWLALSTSLLIVIFIRSSRKYRLICSLICTATLLLFLYPLPWLGQFLWSLTPQTARNITNIWPNQRLYFPITCLVSIIGYIAVAKLYQLANLQQKKIIYFILLICTVWNIEQGYYFIKKFSLHWFQTNWTEKDNLFFHRAGPIDVNTHFFEGSYDPILKNKLLDANAKPILADDNEAFITNLCMKNSKPVYNKLFLYPETFYSENTTTGIQTEKYLLCVKYKNKPQQHLTIEITGKNFPSRYLEPSSLLNSEQISIIPFGWKHPTPYALKVSLNTLHKTIKPIQYGLIPYDSTMLPIHIKSLLPYHATINNTNGGKYLEVFKYYYPGYNAMVNGRPSKVLESPTHLIMIPVIEGPNDITLSYEGTNAMRLSFYISATGWILLLAYLIWRTLPLFSGARRDKS